MAVFLSNGKEVTAFVTVEGRTEYIRIVPEDHGVTLEELREMSDEQILLMVTPQAEEERAVNDAVYAFRNGIGADKFIKIEDSYFHVEVEDISVPHDLFCNMITALAEGDDEYYNSLVLFWKWCALNDSAESRQSMFEFLTRNGYVLTDTGLFVSYRNVVDVETTLGGRTYPRLFTFVAEARLKVRDVWKENLNKHYVKVRNGNEYSLTKSTGIDGTKDVVLLGTLKDVYDACCKETKFTDQYTKEFNIRMGVPVEEKRETCDFNRAQDCGRGLHVGTPDFVTRGRFGDTGIVVLINPKDVVSVPESYTNKMRVNRYLPIEFIRRNKDGQIILPDLKVISDEYSKTSIADLEAKLADIKVTEIDSYRIVPTDIKHSLYNSIRKDLAKIDDAVKGRTVKLASV